MRLTIPYKRKSNNVYDILVSSGLDRGPFIFSLPDNAVREREKSLHGAIDFALEFLAHADMEY